MNDLNSAAIELSVTKEKKFDMSFDSTVRIYGENPEELKKLHQQVDELEVKVAKNTDKLDNIEDGADVSPIIEVKVDGLPLNIIDKAVDIPAATATSLGIIKVDDQTIKAVNGVISLKEVSTDLLKQGTDTLVFNCGNA
jgi:hypothetical protein